MLTLLSQYAAGVAPTKPGYDSYHVLPQMGPLKHIKTIVPSVKGDIALELRNQAKSFSIDLVSPAATTAVIGIPKRQDMPVQSIKANGKTIWENGKFKGRSGKLTFVEETEHDIRFSVQAGEWSIQAAY